MRSVLIGVVVLVLSLGLGGCKSKPGSLVAAPDALVGDYGFKTVQGVTPVLRVVSVNGGGYTFSEYRNGRWVPTGKPAEPMTQADFDKLFGPGASAGVSFVGLEGTGGGAVVQVPPGWHKDRLATQTGYLLVLARGASEAVKM